MGRKDGQPWRSRPSSAFIKINPTYPHFGVKLPTSDMNTARAGEVGVNQVQLLQLAGSCDAVIAVVGKYPETNTGERHYDQFIAHIAADPTAEHGQHVAGVYQFPVEEPCRGRTRGAHKAL